jgi:AcrR family transcriptional regulator
MAPVAPNVSRSRAAVPRGRKPKPRARYHHGDLRRALLEETLRIIHDDGVAGFTLRTVGARLGVSRTALYRHFADKSALLAAVSRDGFTQLRVALHAAFDSGGRDRAAFEAQGRAYVEFAIANPSHYRVMFGGFVDKSCVDTALAAEAEGAFQVLVDTLVALQAAGVVRQDDPRQLALFVWSLVHGLAMLVIDGQLQGRPAADDLLDFTFRRMWSGVEASRASRAG